MPNRLSTTGLLSALLCLCLPAGTHALDAQIEECIRGNTPQTSAVQQIEMRSIDRAGYEKVLVADIYLKRLADETSRLIAYFREPEDIIGTRLLVIEQPPANEMYMYMPSLLKIRRISGKRISSSMYGSDFSYEDIERFYGMLSSEQPVQAPDAEIDGEPMYVLETRPAADSGSKYESVVAYFDQQHCVLRRVDFFEAGNKLRKQLVADADSITTAGSIRLPREFLMTDLRSRTETHLSIRQVELDVALDDELFHHERLKEFRGIR
ncbi:MAG: outer membrane lipoprotein-sorting protein [Thiohalobacterales bacterium]|nr:outer membrane lipoprotein-sorting protein [Thiohalobacterales bacterium]